MEKSSNLAHASESGKIAASGESALLQKLPLSIKKFDPNIGPEKLSGDYIKKLLNNILPASAKELDEYTRYIFTFDRVRKRSKQAHKTSVNGRMQRRLATFKLDKDIRFEQFLPLHNLWEEYIKDALELKKKLPDNLSGLYQKLLKADYHGCFLVVAASKCPHYIGMRGIMVQETRNVFRLVTEDNKLKTIPKKGSTFCFELEGRIFRLYGNNFKFLPYDRLKLKYKRKSIVNFYE